jgi:hypothetical protein
MSPEISIIPLSSIHESYAHDILKSIKDSVKNPIDILIDTNYNSSIKSRIGKYRRQNRDIITIDYDFINTNTINIYFAGQSNNPVKMPLLELIELITTLENEYEDESEFNNPSSENNNNDPIETKIETDKETEKESNCNIM